MTDKIWAVAAGEYSDYRILGVFETKEDADAVAATLYAAPGFGSAYVEEFEFYRAGDRSMRPYTSWSYYLEVHEDGTIHENTDLCGHARSAHPSSDIEPDEDAEEVSPSYYSPFRKCWNVTGVGATEEQARKGARDRAAQVAALVIEGMAPHEIKRYGRSDD